MDCAHFEVSGTTGLEAGFTFVGLVGVIDPPRPGVAAAIEGAHAAGIRVVMLTTDTRPHFAEDDGLSPDGHLVKSQDFDQYCAAIELTLKRCLPRILKAHHHRAWPALQRLTLRGV